LDVAMRCGNSPQWKARRPCATQWDAWHHALTGNISGQRMSFDGAHNARYAKDSIPAAPLFSRVIRRVFFQRSPPMPDQIPTYTRTLTITLTDDSALTRMVSDTNETMLTSRAIAMAHHIGGNGLIVSDDEAGTMLLHPPARIKHIAIGAQVEVEPPT
jgi:hypothetical protein